MPVCIYSNQTGENMERITRNITYKYGDIIKVKPLFCMHIGNSECDEKAIRAFLAENDDKNTYFFTGGDSMDCIVPGDPRYSKDSDGTDKTSVMDEQIHKFIQIMEPYKKRLLGCGMGNHEWQYHKRAGADPIHAASKALDVPHLGYSGFIVLALREKSGRGRKVIIKWHHGWGGGRTAGASLTRYEKDMPSWDADIFCYGHDHQSVYRPFPRIGVSGRKIISKDQFLCVCGTFLKTFKVGKETTYGEKAGFRPVNVGGLVINIKPTADWVKMWVTM